MKLLYQIKNYPTTGNEAGKRGTVKVERLPEVSDTMKYTFIYDERLGISVPELYTDWELLSEAEQGDILLQWEQIRGTIPDQVKRLERIIIDKQNRLNVEDDFPASCRLNSEIAELASTINDLHLWFRVNQEMEAKPHR